MFFQNKKGFQRVCEATNATEVFIGLLNSRTKFKSISITSLKMNLTCMLAVKKINSLVKESYGKQK